MTRRFVMKQLGQDGAKNVALESLLQASLSGLVSNTESNGASRCVLNASIEHVRKLDRAIEEGEEVRRLFSSKGAFSASSLWTCCGLRVSNSCAVTLRAQREQLAIDEAKLLANAQASLQKFITAGRTMSITNKDWDDVVRWVLPEAKLPDLCVT